MSWYKPWTWGDESESTKEQRADVTRNAQAAEGFADAASYGFNRTGTEAQESRDYMRDLATGKNSLSAEQLRQGLQQQQAQMQSMAAGGPASAAPMNARTAMIQAGRASSAMAGNAAMAGIQERAAAQKAWMDAILAARNQELQAALDSRRTATAGYGSTTTDKSFLDKWGNAIISGAGIAAQACDETVKTDVQDASADIDVMLDTLNPVDFRYATDHGAPGVHTGVMAQDLQRSTTGARLVFEADDGVLHVDLNRAVTTLLAVVARLNERIRVLEAQDEPAKGEA